MIIRFEDAPSRGEPLKPTTSNPTRDQRRSTLFPDNQNKPEKSASNSREKSWKPSDKSADIKDEVKKEPEELPDFLKSGAQSVAGASGGFKPFQVYFFLLQQLKLICSQN